MIAVKGRLDSSSRLYDGSIWKQPKEEGILRIVVCVIPPRVNDVLYRAGILEISPQGVGMLVLAYSTSTVFHVSK